MNRSLVGLVVMVMALVTFLMAPCGVQAARKPVVISHDETYVNRTVRFRVNWQAENPVVMVKIFTGRDQKEIKVDEYDNKRIRNGYAGEVSVIVELDPSFMEESLAYVIQLEDDVRLKSDPVNGKLQIVRVKKEDDNWGSDKLGGSGTASVGAPYGSTTGQTTGGTGVEIIDRVIGVMDRHDMPPILGNILITKVGVDGVGVGTRASDDKALTGVAFKIFDNAGNLVQQDVATPTGKSWEGSSKFFNLVNGNYKAVVQATDSAGNTSPEKTEFFAITGAPAAAVYPSTNMTTTTTTTTTTPVSSAESQPVVPTSSADQTPATQTPASQPTQ